MKLDRTRILHDSSGGAISRRNLLKTAAALAVSPSASLLASSAPGKSKGSILAYIGAYTPNGQGIYLFSMDLESGALTQLKVASTVPNPSWIAIHPNGNFLYAVNEISNFNGTTSGSVSAFSIDRSTGDLTFLNAVSSQGAGPAFVSIDPLGQFAFVANYGGGSFAVLPILNNGRLADASDVQHDVGSVGPKQATDAPPGSFAISGHDAPHAHMIQPDPAGKFVLGIDLGQDRIYSWMLNRNTGKLVPNSPAFFAVPPGDGPRHLAFHPSGAVLYALLEEASALLVYTYDSSNGSLTQQQLISTLPDGFAGTDFASEVRVSPDGSRVYAANRLHDSIAFFSVDAPGTLSPLDEEWTRGDYPRSFTIDPTGSFLVCCNQRGDALTTFEIKNKKLEFRGNYTPIGSPACVVFLA